MTLCVVSQGLAAASAGVEALTTRLPAKHAGPAQFNTAVTPPATNPGRLQNAAKFCTHGSQYAAASYSVGGR